MLTTPRFNWINYGHAHPQGFVLSGFYWGYSLVQVPGGWLADKHGGEVVLCASSIGWSVAVMAMAMAGNLSHWILFLANLLNGVAQGMFKIASSWFLPS